MTLASHSTSPTYGRILSGSSSQQAAACNRCRDRFAMTELGPLDTGFMEMEDTDRRVSLGIGT
ncbi:hypothetical protein, partial [Nocardia abscessus]|uniref:hypothetical protein n=1 Tax=Nocardia abscessus TaxID=120957 RepID=UPI001E50533F